MAHDDWQGDGFAALPTQVAYQPAGFATVFAPFAVRVWPQARFASARTQPTASSTAGTASTTSPVVPFRPGTTNQ